MFGNVEEKHYLCNVIRKSTIMPKFKVTRPVIVTTTDIWEADSEEQIWDRLNNGKSLAGEISQLGLDVVPGRAVKYEFLEDKVEKL